MRIGFHLQKSQKFVSRKSFSLYDMLIVSMLDESVSASMYMYSTCNAVRITLIHDVLTMYKLVLSAVQECILAVVVNLPNDILFLSVGRTKSRAESVCGSEEKTDCI